MSRIGHVIFLLGVLLLPSLLYAAGTPQSDLAYRVALGRAEDVRLLIKQGGNPNGVDQNNVPLLLVASGRKDEEGANVVRALVESGANINAKDAQGQTALYYAARTGKKAVVTYLLEHKIDYYSLDKNGDIARTIAFRAEHPEILELMDNFVKNQTTQIKQQYQNIAQTVQEQQVQQAREAEEAARKAEEEAKAEALAEEKRQKEIRRQQELEAKKRREEYVANVKKLGQKVYDLSYHTCAFEYWSFCKAAPQTTELSPDELNAAIDGHKELIESISLEIMEMFSTNQQYVHTVIDPSKQQIYNELDAMPSRTYRKEHGVGTLEDVRSRCEAIANNWNINGKLDAPTQKVGAAPPAQASSPIPPAVRQLPRKPQPPVRYRDNKIRIKLE